MQFICTGGDLKRKDGTRFCVRLTKKMQHIYRATAMVMNKPDRCCFHIRPSLLKVLKICEIMHVHRVFPAHLVTIIHT